MSLYEIINPSDPYTIECSRLNVLAVVSVLMNGKYGFDPLDGAEGIPPFLFGGSKEWFKKHFGKTVDELYDDVMANHYQELINAFDGVLIGSARDREEFIGATELMSVEQRDIFKKQRHEKRRSSLNDIGGTCYENADRLRKWLAKKQNKEEVTTA